MMFLGNNQLLMKRNIFEIGLITAIIFLAGFVLPSKHAVAQLAPNIPPYANGAEVGLDENTSQLITLSGYDQDEGPSSLTFSIVDGPVNGVLSDLNPETGEVTYTPNQNYFGNDSFTFNVFDGADYSLEPGTVYISVFQVEDTEAPYTSISTPESNSIIEGEHINISGVTTDNEIVASTTIAFSPYITEGDYSYCDYQAYSELVSLINTNQTSNFEWSFDWAPSSDGTYCFRAYSEDINGNKEIEFDRNFIEVQNVGFKKVLPVVVPQTPTSRPGGHRRPTTGGEVLGASTTAPQIIQAPISVPAVEPLTGSVKIVWKTNIPSTSRVVYGSTLDGPYKLDIDTIKNGYIYSTIENSAMVTNHEVILKNITVGLSYSFRVVSKISNPTFSPEYRFTLGKDGVVKFEGMYGNEIVIENTSKTTETIHDFVKVNNPKIKDLFAN